MKSKHTKFGETPIAVTSLYAVNTPNAKDIIFIHMSWGGAWAFRYYMPFFQQHDYNCHAVDLRGHGKSGGTVAGASMQDYVDDVKTALHGLAIENPIIIGHSMGGLVALMCASQFPTLATIALDASPSLEVQKTSEEKHYPSMYTITDAGMPSNPMKMMRALSDIPIFRLLHMRMHLGRESGIARSDRKRGISVPQDSLTQPLYFIGAGRGTSLPFGIGIEKVRAQAQYYHAPVYEVPQASHPGLLIGKHWKQGAQAILDWINSITP